MNPSNSIHCTHLHGSMTPGYDKALTPGALHFISRHYRSVNPGRLGLLAELRKCPAPVDPCVRPDYLPETRQERETFITLNACERIL